MTRWWLLVLVWFAGPAFAATVAVLPWEAASKSEAHDGLGRALAGMLVSDLSRAPGVELVERARLDALLAEVALGDSGYLDPKTAARLGSGVGAQWVVVGSYTVIGTQFLMDGRAVDVASGRVITAADAQGTTQDFVSVEKAVVEKLIAGLALELSASARRQLLADAPTEDFRAVATYGAGLQAEFEGRIEDARKRFEEANQLDPAFDLPLQRIAELRAKLEALEIERRATQVDARTAAWLAALDNTPNELAQKGPTPDDRARALASLRFTLLGSLKRHCQAADELAHYLDRHAGKLAYSEAHPGPYNRFHREAFALGLYESEPKVWNHGAVMPPRGVHTDFLARNTQVGSVGGLVIDLVDGPDRAGELGRSLVNHAIACAGPDRSAQLLAVQRVIAQVDRLKLRDERQYPSSGMPIGVLLEVLRLQILADRDGMTPALDAALAKLLTLDLGPDETFALRNRVEDITRRAEGAERRARVLQGMTPEQVLALQRALVAGDASVVRSEGACAQLTDDRAREVAKQSLARLESEYTGGPPSPQGWTHVLQVAGAQGPLRLLGCRVGEPALFGTLAEAIAWVETADRRQRAGRNEAACATALTEVQREAASAKQAHPTVHAVFAAQLARSAHAKLLTPGCVSAR